MLPYIESNGWTAEIIAVNIADLESPVIDNFLLKTIPDTIKVHFVGAFKYQITRKFGLGSLSLRSFYFYFKYLKNYLEQNKVDLIFFSTTSFHLLALGPLMKKRFNVPYVLDIQDPWRSDFYLNKPKNERPPKFWLNYKLDKYLESFTIPKSDAVVSVSKSYIDTFKQRYKGFSPLTKTIPFSGSKEDFEVLEKIDFIDDLRLIKNNKINIVYVGRGGNDMAFACDAFFQAVKHLKQNQFDRYAELNIVFIGTSYLPQGQGKKTIFPLAQKYNLNDVVVEVTDRVGYFESLNLLKSADILFIPGSTDSSYTASKIYPYILANKPIIAFFNENSSVVKIIDSCTKSKVVTFNNSTLTSDLVMQLYASLYFAVNNFKLNNFQHDEINMEPYLAKAMTRSLCALFDDVINARNN